MANDVVFRRINGRVVPIKKSGTGGKPKALPNYRKPTKTEHNFSRGLSAAGGVGGLVYTSGKISKFRVDRKVSAINDALSELNLKRPKPFTRIRPKKPNAYGMDDTPLARAMNKRFQKDSKAFLAAKRLSEKRQTEFASKFARAKPLDFKGVNSQKLEAS